MWNTSWDSTPLLTAHSAIARGTPLRITIWVKPVVFNLSCTLENTNVQATANNKNL